MTYDEFMNRPLWLYDRIMHDADHVAFLFEVCTKSTGSLGERVQTSPTNKTSRNYAAYIDANNALQELVQEYNSAKEEVASFLYDNLNHDDADLLEWKYINAKDLKQIAEIKSLAYQTVKNRISVAEKRAIQKFINSVPKSTEKYHESD